MVKNSFRLKCLRAAHARGVGDADDVVETSADVRQAVDPCRELHAEAFAHVLCKVAAIESKHVVLVHSVLLHEVGEHAVDALVGEARAAEAHGLPEVVRRVRPGRHAVHARGRAGVGPVHAEGPLEAIDFYARVEETPELHGGPLVRQDLVQVLHSPILRQVVDVEQDGRSIALWGGQSRLPRPGCHGLLEAAAQPQPLAGGLRRPEAAARAALRRGGGR
mmetsp:Transcript_105714/g.328331  ORF Transcript_105714/g.328331 Transcript_105714/m.328331 type:complete len:220 (+) Transcript_105714:8-667(+)